MKDRSYRTRTAETGFTLIELLVVVAIIAIMAAVALPAIGRYIRVYQIQGATQQVASEITAARLKAIGRNVNNGVVFVIWSPREYQWVMEDLPNPNPPATPPPCPATSPIPSVLGSPWQAPLPLNECATLHGARRSLPAGVEFDPAPTTGTPNDCAFRFTRFGMWEHANQRPLSPACTSGQTFIVATSQGVTTASIGVRQSNTGLRGAVLVSSGGRVQVRRGW
jgi:prepilin-type N-terminal cleavage/methylation domain-containing protein